MADAVPMKRTCGTMQVHERLLRTVPGYLEARAASENHAWRAAFSPMAARTGCTKIPVVVHVVYKTSAQNISDAQVKSQITILNEDFRKTNTDASAVPAIFQPLAADARIEFELASTDPAGSATDGIVRVKTTQDSFSDDDSVKASGSGGSDAWPSDKYLNVWVCQLGGGLLGYAQFPGSPAATDGVVILHSAFGNTGTAASPFDKGRSATHEIGHWLNLRHIWGDDGTGCSGSDFVADTPNQAGPNYGAPSFPTISCSNGPNGDMFMNYMDYVDDAAMMMFTAGQVVRMQATLDGLRSAIGSSIPCLTLPLPCVPLPCLPPPCLPPPCVPPPCLPPPCLPPPCRPCVPPPPCLPPPPCRPCVPPPPCLPPPPCRPCVPPPPCLPPPPCRPCVPPPPPCEACGPCLVNPTVVQPPDLGTLTSFGRGYDYSQPGYGDAGYRSGAPYSWDPYYGYDTGSIGWGDYPASWWTGGG